MVTSKQLMRRIASRRHPGAGCSDGGCVFGPPGGMHTNGGCECLKERDVNLMRRSLMRIADVARVLASIAEVPDDK